LAAVAKITSLAKNTKGLMRNSNGEKIVASTMSYQNQNSIFISDQWLFTSFTMSRKFLKKETNAFIKTKKKLYQSEAMIYKAFSLIKNTHKFY
jgi:hypothetical protein